MSIMLSAVGCTQTNKESTDVNDTNKTDGGDITEKKTEKKTQKKTEKATETGKKTDMPMTPGQTKTEETLTEKIYNFPNPSNCSG